MAMSGKATKKDPIMVQIITDTMATANHMQDRKYGKV